MGKAKILFVYPYNIIGDVVDIAEGEGLDPSHVAVFACGGLLEAVREGVVVSPANKYDGHKIEVVEVEVPFPEIGEAAGHLLQGRHYGLFTSCLSGLIRDTTGKEIAIGDDSSANCSEVGVLYLRCCGVDLFPLVPAKCITPRALLEALRKEKKNVA